MKTRRKKAPPESKLSAVEAAHFAEWSRLAGGAKPSLTFLRKEIRRVAYHEAAHVAARMFTGHEASHVLLVSILPDAATDTLGRERSERNVSEVLLPHYPDDMKQANGRCLLLSLLAGRAAEDRLDDSPSPLADEMALRWCETWEQEGTDFFRAEKIAGIMARPGFPAHRVLHLAAKWTEEMLAVPEVWATVERLAALLIERGEIADREEIESVCEGIVFMVGRLPRWKRRLFFDPRRLCESSNPQGGLTSAPGSNLWMRK